ncbi:MAG: prepilin-type N-terminal cleavage/methylation domain-containing protein [Thermodesulfobacteriota bacterium]
MKVRGLKNSGLRFDTPPGINHAAEADREAGFTLLEVMVSLAILGIGILMVMQLFSGGLGLAVASSNHTEAVLLAREKMAETLVDKDLYPGVIEGTDDSGLRWQVKVTPFTNANTDNNGYLYIMKIVVSIRKADKDEPVYRLTSMKSIFLEE